MVAQGKGNGRSRTRIQALGSGAYLRTCQGRYSGGRLPIRSPNPRSTLQLNRNSTIHAKFSGHDSESFDLVFERNQNIIELPNAHQIIYNLQKRLKNN